MKTTKVSIAKITNRFIKHHKTKQNTSTNMNLTKLTVGKFAEIPYPEANVFRGVLESAAKNREFENSPRQHLLEENFVVGLHSSNLYNRTVNVGTKTAERLVSLMA